MTDAWILSRTLNDVEREILIITVEAARMPVLHTEMVHPKIDNFPYICSFGTKHSESKTGRLNTYSTYPEDFVREGNDFQVVVYEEVLKWFQDKIKQEVENDN